MVFRERDGIIKVEKLLWIAYQIFCFLRTLVLAMASNGHKSVFIHKIFK